MRRQVSDIFQLPEDKVDVVPNAVATRDFAIPPDEVAAFRARVTPAGEKMVIFAGRLEYEKGVQTVLHALEHVRDVVGDVIFYVAGVGTYSDELRRMVDELGLDDHVRFTGFLEDHDLRLHYAAADVAVAPSIYEPFGLVAVEAMACGTPVVVGDTGGLREIVEGGHGLRFEPQDVDELAERLIAVLTDTDLAHELITRGRERIRTRYDWQRVAERTVAVYRQAIVEEAALEHPERRPALRDLLRAEPILELSELLD
jgi:glycosyltransferase involved in cell wall biosynthesis